jgi:mono/diheme cytochrome c family protein
VPRLLKVLGALSLLGLVLAMAGLAALLQRGVSARAEPWVLEAWAARGLRHLAVPRAERRRRSPLPSHAEAAAEGRDHFADHCAVCHANDGSGDTAFGRGLYPPPPDMRLPATQALADGELFWIIRNGVRFTGMPGFATGPAEEDEGTWQLVHFIREIPELSGQDLAQMRRLNPISRDELEEQLAVERFLAGGEPPGRERAQHGH